MKTPEIRHSGDCAVTVEYGKVIDEAINAAVFSLMQELEKQSVPGIIELVPTYRSLTIHYDPQILLYAELKKVLEKTFSLVTDGSRRDHVVVEVPVLYGGEAGPDLGYVADHCGKTEEEVIQIHSSKDYLIYMMGFLPGFTYLGGMDPSIACPRLETPRTKIPSGSVGIAGTQTGAYSMESPGGWQIIGRTPLSLFTPEEDPPVLLKAGQYVRFVPISQKEYDQILEGKSSRFGTHQGKTLRHAKNAESEVRRKP